jgi:hypothetical protein
VARCLGWGRDGQRRARADSPQWLRSVKEERQWWGPHGGENEGGQWPEMAAVNEAPSVEMAHDVGSLRGLFIVPGSR